MSQLEALLKEIDLRLKIKVTGGIAGVNLFDDIVNPISLFLLLNQTPDGFKDDVYELVRKVPATINLIDFNMISNAHFVFNKMFHHLFDTDVEYSSNFSHRSVYEVINRPNLLFKSLLKFESFFTPELFVSLGKCNSSYKEFVFSLTHKSFFKNYNSNDDFINDIHSMFGYFDEKPNVYFIPFEAMEYYENLLSKSFYERNKIGILSGDFEYSHINNKRPYYIPFFNKFMSDADIIKISEINYDRTSFFENFENHLSDLSIQQIVESKFKNKTPSRHERFDYLPIRVKELAAEYVLKINPFCFLDFTNDLKRKFYKEIDFKLNPTLFKSHPYPNLINKSDWFNALSCNYIKVRDFPRHLLIKSGFFSLEDWDEIINSNNNIRSKDLKLIIKTHDKDDFLLLSACNSSNRSINNKDFVSTKRNEMKRKEYELKIVNDSIVVASEKNERAVAKQLIKLFSNNIASKNNIEKILKELTKEKGEK